jgi:hypothetical protein
MSRLDGLLGYLARTQPPVVVRAALQVIASQPATGRSYADAVLALLDWPELAGETSSTLRALAPLPATLAPRAIQLATAHRDVWVRACAAATLDAYAVDPGEVVPVLEQLLTTLPIGARYAAWWPLLTLAPEHAPATKAFCEELQRKGIHATTAAAQLPVLSTVVFHRFERALVQAVQKKQADRANAIWYWLGLRARDGAAVVDLARRVARLGTGRGVVDAIAGLPGGSLGVRTLALVAAAAPAATDFELVRGLLAPARAIVDEERAYDLDQLGCLVQGLLAHAAWLREVDELAARGAKLAVECRRDDFLAAQTAIEQIVAGVTARPYGDVAEPLRGIVAGWVRLPIVGRKICAWSDQEANDEPSDRESNDEPDEFWVRGPLDLKRPDHDASYQIVEHSSRELATIERQLERYREDFEVRHVSHDTRIRELDYHLHQFRDDLLSEPIYGPHVTAAGMLLGDALVARGWTWVARRLSDPVLGALIRPQVAVISPDRRLGVALYETMRAAIAQPVEALDFFPLSHHFALASLERLRPEWPGLHWFDIAEPAPPRAPVDFGRHLATRLISIKVPYVRPPPRCDR